MCIFDLLCFVALSCIPYELVEREIGHPLCERWRELAFKLGFSKKVVYHITSTYGRNNLQCMCEGVIKTWLNRRPEWETMLRALHEMGEVKRAKDLRMKYVEGSTIPLEWKTDSVYGCKRCSVILPCIIVDPGLTIKVVGPMDR